IFPVREDRVGDASHNTLLASARIVMHAQNGTLVEQLKRTEELSADLQPVAAIPAGKTLATGDTGLDEMRSIAAAPTQVEGKRRQKTDGTEPALW
ncbi:hypothetical protein KC221_23055, partial [Mycobacterium tuberculosis]|nr:hypothetical protein [Mycobacterium tuberculosis]